MSKLEQIFLERPKEILFKFYCRPNTAGFQYRGIAYKPICNRFHLPPIPANGFTSLSATNHTFTSKGFLWNSIRNHLDHEGLLSKRKRKKSDNISRGISWISGNNPSKIKDIEKLWKPMYGTLVISTRGVKWKPRNNHFDPNFEESIYGSRPRTQVGGITTITLVPGMGGQSQWEAVKEIIRCAGAPIQFEIIKKAETSDEELDNLLLSIQRNGIAVKGNIETRSKEIEPGIEISRNMMIRKSLDLFVRVNWFKSLKPLESLMRVPQDVDIVLMRQNTEGEFSLLEYMPLPNICEHLAIVTRYNSTRLAEYAFTLSKQLGRKKIALVLNKMIIPESEEIFSTAFLEVAKKYPDVNYELMDISRFTVGLQSEAKSFDVIVASSLIGSILASVLQGILGSPELIPSLNVGDRYQVWEAAYISTVTKNRIMTDNPISHIQIIISILNHLGNTQTAQAIHESLEETLYEGVKTKDMLGTASIEEFTRVLISFLKPKIPVVQCPHDEPPSLPPKPPPTEPFRPEFLPGMTPPKPNYKEFPPDEPTTFKKS